MRAAEFIADGLAAHERIAYVGESVESMSAELEETHSGRAALSSRHVHVHATADFFRFAAKDGIVDAEASIMRLPVAVDAAVAEGYAGLRLITDATALAKSPRHRRALSDLEYLLDRMVASCPMSAMCAFDLAVVDSAGMTEIACLHPSVKRGSASFRLYAERDCSVAIAGEVDLASQDLFVASIDRMARLTEPGHDRVVLRLDGVTFLGHHSLMTIDTTAAARGILIEVHSARPVVRRMAEFLDLSHLEFFERRSGTAV